MGLGSAAGVKERSSSPSGATPPYHVGSGKLGTDIERFLKSNW